MGNRYNSKKNCKLCYTFPPNLLCVPSLLSPTLCSDRRISLSTFQEMVFVQKRKKGGNTEMFWKEGSHFPLSRKRSFSNKRKRWKHRNVLQITQVSALNSTRAIFSLFSAHGILLILSHFVSPPEQARFSGNRAAGGKEDSWSWEKKQPKLITLKRLRKKEDNKR